MQCIDIRWKFSEFLSGKLDDNQAEHIAEHLEKCRECTSYMLDAGKIEQSQVTEISLKSEFTTNVVKSALASRDENNGFNFLGLTLVGSLLLSFLAMFLIRHFSSNEITAQISSKVTEAESILSLLPHFSNILDSSLANYLILAFLALILCSGLVLLVDISDQLINKSNYRRKEI